MRINNLKVFDIPCESTNKSLEQIFITTKTTVKGILSRRN
jgi:hypothetical protein